MFKFYFLAVNTGLSLAIYHHNETLLSYFGLQVPPFAKQYINKWFPKQKSETIIDIPKKDVVEDYIELSENTNQRIMYSRLHKRPLAFHQVVTNLVFEQENQVQLKQQNNLKNSSQVENTPGQVQKQLLTQNVSTLSNKSETDSELNDTKFSKSQVLYKNFFNVYAKQLLSAKLCNSVELISGPIYSKDTQYKTKKQGQQKKQVVDNVYVSYVKISPSGEYLTDRFFTLVVCSSQTRQKYLNAFAMRRSYASETFRLTNYLTSLKRLQEQTGLQFNLQGEPLTLIDYKGINRDRIYSDFEAK